MSLRSNKKANKRANPIQVLSRLALSLVLLPNVCPWAQALETTQDPTQDHTQSQTQGQTEDQTRATPTGQVGAKANLSALDVLLDKYQKAIDEKTLSVSDFQKLADLATQYPANSRVHLLFGRGFDMQGLADQAVEQYTIADKYGPRDPEAIAAILHNVIAKGAGEAANTLLNSAIRRFPNNPEILYMIGKRLKEKHHWTEAGTVFVRAYATGKKVQGLPSDLGELWVDQDPYKAISLAKEDLASNPNFAPALMVLSKALMRLGNFEQALAPLEKLYKQSPTSEESTWMYLRCLYWSGDYKTALEPAFYCLRNDSAFEVSGLRSATTLSKVLGNLPANYAVSALQNFYDQTEKAKTPVQPPFHFYVGRIFFQQHRLPEAKAELLRYADSNPKSAETLWMLGEIAEIHDHDYEAALKYYRLAHALLPYHTAIAGACLGMEERIADHNNDWAWCLKDWLHATFSWSPH